MKSSAPQSCNVLALGADRRKLWRFATGGGSANLSAEQNAAATDPLPARLVAKDWTNLWQHKLNIAWLPSDQVFLRVLHLPKCDFSELLAMVEFQLEKISPLPVAQATWGLEVIPSQSKLPSESQTVLVIIVPRHIVEAFLGDLEGKGFLADQLEVPLLHELLATAVDSDGVWVYPRQAGGKSICVTAWWYGGVLQSVSLISVSGPENFALEVGDLLAKATWAGELEGWLTAPPQYHLVADAATAQAWQAPFTTWAGQSVNVTEPLGEKAIAAASALRAARCEPVANLVPVDFTARYRQQFVDRIWMRGLGALLLVYVTGVLAYFGALLMLEYQQHRIEDQIAELQESFTKSQQLQARIQLVREQANLKYAALDCWKAVTDAMPGELSLTSMSFTRGKNLVLGGISSEATKVTDYVENLTRLTDKEHPIFSRVESGRTSTGPGLLGPQTTTWSISCELDRKEMQ